MILVSEFDSAKICQFKRLQNKIFRTEHENQRREKKFNLYLSRYRFLLLAFYKQKSKLHALRAKKSQYYEEQLTCINCGDLFYESSNCSWACKTHTSNWIQDKYWCCGKSDIDAPGCTKFSHISNEDDLDIDSAKPKIVCASCQKTGHQTKNCPNDPNVRSDFQANEINRVNQISYKKYTKSIVTSQKLKIDEYDDCKTSQR